MMRKIHVIIALFLIPLLVGCTGTVEQTSNIPPSTDSPTTAATEPISIATTIPESTEEEPDMSLADVISVIVSGDPESYTFSVGISSPDIGCQQYADWWEVVSLEGDLLYRRILLHSHVTEQPFTRSGGPVEIGTDTEVIIRAHMNPGGYGGKAYQGSVGLGFKEVDLGKDFGADLENQDPLPSGCNF